MHAVENKQYQHQQLLKTKKEKVAYAQRLMEDFHLPSPKPSQSSFLSTTISVAGDAIPSFRPKVSLRVAGLDDKAAIRTRLKPVREIQEEDKTQKESETLQDQYGEENVEKRYGSETQSPVFVTPVEVTTTKTTKSYYKHRSSLKLNDSCETTCLMNIVNHDVDPLCGSNDHTYMNVGKFRCAKICGQLREYNSSECTSIYLNLNSYFNLLSELTIKHFGNCEDDKATKA